MENVGLEGRADDLSSCPLNVGAVVRSSGVVVVVLEEYRWTTGAGSGPSDG